MWGASAPVGPVVALSDPVVFRVAVCCQYVALKKDFKKTKKRFKRRVPSVGVVLRPFWSTGTPAPVWRHRFGAWLLGPEVAQEPQLLDGGWRWLLPEAGCVVGCCSYRMLQLERS